MADGSTFRGAKPRLEHVIPIAEVKKIPVEYDSLGYNRQFAKDETSDEYEQMSLFDAL